MGVRPLGPLVTLWPNQLSPLLTAWGTISPKPSVTIAR